MSERCLVCWRTTPHGIVPEEDCKFPKCPLRAEVPSPQPLGETPRTKAEMERCNLELPNDSRRYGDMTIFACNLEREIAWSGSAWKWAMEERDYWQRKYKELRALMPRSEEEH